MEKNFEYYMEAAKDYRIEGAGGMVDFQTWASEDDDFKKFISDVKSNPKIKHKSYAESPTGKVELEWMPEKDGEEKLDIWFLSQRDGSPERPIANSWRGRIWYHLFEKDK